MITSPEEFRQQLLDIQNSVDVVYTTLPSDEPRFIIDANSRTITIPPEFQFLGVKNDHNAETIYFEIDRYFDDEDLSKHTCVVQFSNKNNSNDGGIYPVTTMDTTSVDGKIIFGWEIKSDATSLVGDIYFSVRFYSINSTDYVFTYNFNTLTAKSVILDTLDVDNPGIFENYPSELDAWLDRMNELEAGTSGKVEEIEAKGQEVLTEINSVKDSIPEDYSTLSSEVSELKSDLDAYLYDNSLMIISDKYLMSNGGTGSVGGYSISDYLNVASDTIIILCSEYVNGLNVAFYDIDKNFISGIVGKTRKVREMFDVPANARYFRFGGQTVATLKLFFGVGSSAKNTLDRLVDSEKQLKKIGTVVWDSSILTISDKWIDKSGNTQSLSNFNNSDYLPIFMKNIVLTSVGYTVGLNLAFYDKNKEFISGVNAFNKTPMSVDVPTNARYMRFSGQGKILDAYAIISDNLKNIMDNFGVVSDKVESNSAIIDTILSSSIIRNNISNMLVGETRTINIKLIGDSITAGVGGTGYSATGTTIFNEYKRNESGYCWANLLKDYFESKFNCNVINNGISGFQSNAIVSWLSNLISVDDDIVICMIGTNDRANDSVFNGLRNNLISIYDYCVTNGKKIIFMSSVPASITDESNYLHHMEDVNHVISSVAIDKGLEYIDLYSMFIDYCDMKDIAIDSLLSDGLHPNDKGYKLMFRFIAKSIGLVTKRTDATW